MLAILYVIEKVPRPLLVLMGLLFLFTMIVAHSNHPSPQEKHHVHADRSPR